MGSNLSSDEGEIFSKESSSKEYTEKGEINKNKVLLGKIEEL